MLHIQQSSFIFAGPECTPDIKEYTANIMFHGSLFISKQLTIIK
jgi:hypothetical protein